MLSNVSDNFIPTSNISFCRISVTEKIASRFLTEFISTSLEEHNILITTDTFIWHRFIESLKIYEIYALYSSLSNFDIIPNIISKFYKDSDEANIDLFILEDTFVLFQNKQLYCFKNIQDSSEEDIKTYIMHTYQLDIDNIYFIDDVQLNQLYLLYISDNIELRYNPFKRLKEDKSFLFFSIFSFISIFIFVGLLYNSYMDQSNNPQVQQLAKIQKQYENLKLKQNNLNIIDGKFIPKLADFFRYIKLKKLIIKDVAYSAKKVKLSLVHKKKERLLDFVIDYTNKIDVQQIEFVEELSLYRMGISLEL